MNKNMTTRKKKLEKCTWKKNFIKRHGKKKREDREKCIYVKVE
jgi:hypothetical protein